MVKKLTYKKFYQWLDTCPVSWDETNHPTSGMTSVTFDLEKILTKEKPKAITSKEWVKGYNKWKNENKKR
jgi:hypothetical protein|tara:strand:+ start:291 stop:500 length:210 start_codon:yes stop_codon:yes gene_type:complete